MRRIVVSMFVSLDGLMEDPGGAGQFEHGGWTRSYWGDDIGQAWPSMKDEQGFADRMNGLPTFVVSAP